MSEWTHACCERCWIERNVEIVSDEEFTIKRPVFMTEREALRCCFCGDMTIVGIFTRADPKKTLCREHWSAHEACS